MDRTFETVLEEVMELDRESQITIAEKILAKVSDSEEHDAPWRAEIRSRVAAYERGEMKTVDSEESIARMRKIISEARARQ
jgi:putative addiction module component (TIGR02574 family)